MSDKNFRVPRNTQHEVSENPGGFMVEAMLLGGNAIERQEAEGQKSFVSSETLPTSFGSINSKGKAILEKAGVKFLGQVSDDPVFQQVELPSGWKKVATDHSMWSNLVDGQGRIRANIFYKAAFYDRSAHTSVTRRYAVNFDYKREEAEGVAVAEVRDGEIVLFSTEPVKVPADQDKEYFKITDGVKATAHKWLQQNFPQWEDPGAYWD